MIKHNAIFFKDFDLIIASRLSSTSLLALSLICRELGRALLVVDSIGFLGRIRVDMPEHTSNFEFLHYLFYF